MEKNGAVQLGVTKDENGKPCSTVDRDGEPANPGAKEKKAGMADIVSTLRNQKESVQ